MAPKKKAAQADKGRVEEEVEEPLQAVVCSLTPCRLAQILMKHRFSQTHSRLASVHSPLNALAYVPDMTLITRQTPSKNCSVCFLWPTLR